MPCARTGGRLWNFPMRQCSQKHKIVVDNKFVNLYNFIYKENVRLWFIAGLIDAVNMDKSRFLYYFTKIYLGEAVKETILIENWEEGDFCTRYVEYADIFTKLGKEYVEGNIQDKDAIDLLSKNKRILVEKFNQVISNNFLDQLNNRSLAREAAQKIILNKIPLGGDNINPNILEVFRELEEEVYTSKQGDV